MELSEDAVVEIPPARLGFFGGPGKMLLPSPATVAALIAKVPAGKLITTNLLCQVLARQFNVREHAPLPRSGPFRPLRMTRAAKSPTGGSSRRTEEPMTRFPGGADGQAERLRKEGFAVDGKAKAPKIANFRASLVRL